jgi:hypothetical protein
VFDDLYDTMSKLFSWWWPSSEGEVTAVDIDSVVDRYGERLLLVVSYKFSLGDDGPYTGEYSWEPGWSARVLAAKDNMHVGLPVTVRYRPDDPSVNTLDRRTWRDF